MILRDRVTVEHQGGDDTPNVRAQVVPLRTTTKLGAGAGDLTITTIHVTAYMHPEANAEERGCTAIHWRGQRWQIEGFVEPWTNGAGRLHHYQGTFVIHQGSGG